MSSIKIAHFFPIRLQTWPPQAILFSDWPIFKMLKISTNRPIINKNCLWQPYLLMDRDEMSNLYRGPPIDTSYEVSDHLVKRFQRRRFLKISQSETRIACGGHVCKRIGIK
jgi:hypothetical protein